MNESIRQLVHSFADACDDQRLIIFPSSTLPEIRPDEEPLVVIGDAARDATSRLVITDRAVYAAALAETRLPLERIVAESSAKGRFYLNDQEVFSLPEGGRVTDELVRLIRGLCAAAWKAAPTLPELKDENSSHNPLRVRLQSAASEEQLLAGKYRLLREIGKGAYGRVSLARDVRLDLLVAIKQLTQHAARNAQSQARFIQEARALSRLHTPHIAAVYALEYLDGDYFLVLEYLDAGTLADRLIVRPCFEERVGLRVACDILRGLREAHSHGIVHRDLKPANILFNERGQAKLTDFGVAHMPTSEGGLALTTEGCAIGTVLYMAPEQVHGQAVDGRADLYAVGALLYRMLSGRHYLEETAGVSLHHAFEAILNDRPTPLAQLNPSLSSDVSGVVHRLLEKDPADRFSSAAEVIELLDYLRDSDCRKPPVALATTLSEPSVDEDHQRKYRLAVELFLADGVIVQREREVLEEKARLWGIASAIATAIEDEVAEQAGLAWSMHDILDFEETVRLFLTDGVLQPAEQAILIKKARAYGLSEDVVENILTIVRQELQR